MKTSKSWLALLSLSAHCLVAEVIETDDISHALVHATQGALFIFDLDNTLIEPKQVLGSDQWVTYMFDKCVAQGDSYDEAHGKIISCWADILHYTEMCYVDPVVPYLLKALQQKHFAHLGMTKRDPAVMEHTLEQIKTLKMAFHPEIKIANGYVFEDAQGSTYQEGVIFVSKASNKGESLAAYLKHLPQMPSRIIVIDDKLSHLKSMEPVAKKLGIPFIGLRYSALDDKVKNFNPEVADMQLKRFKTILSDEEAATLVSTRAHK